MATLSPQRALTSVDLPTFGRPATTTNPDLTAAAERERCRADRHPLCLRRLRRRCPKRTRPSGAIAWATGLLPTLRA
jgi:hypothetical protein